MEPRFPDFLVVVEAGSAEVEELVCTLRLRFKEDGRGVEEVGRYLWRFCWIERRGIGSGEYKNEDKSILLLELNAGKLIPLSISLSSRLKYFDSCCRPIVLENAGQYEGGV